jgi:insulysin
LLAGDSDADLLQSITKAEILELFRARVHPDSPERAKLSVHLKSQKKKPAKLSSEALRAFEKSVNAYITVEGTSWKDELGVTDTMDNIIVDDLTQYWTEKLGSASSQDDAKAQDIRALLNSIPDLMLQHPGDEDSDILDSGVTVIEDLKSFRSGLRLSVDAEPLVDWGDLKGDDAKL